MPEGECRWSEVLRGVRERVVETGERRSRPNAAASGGFERTRTFMRYEPVSPLSREQLVANLESDDTKLVAEALYSAARFEQDWEWVQDHCLFKLNSLSVPIRWAAATGLGDMAFRRCPLTLDKVIPALEEAKKDPEIADPAAFNLSMVKQFLKSD
jgi:hypothetical protein